MSTHISKAQLLSELHEEQASWEALLDSIGEARMSEPGVAGAWSIKDIVIHLAGWRRRTVGRLQAALHHQPNSVASWPSSLQTDDEINAWMVASKRDLPLSAILQEDREVFQQLVDTLDAFPEAELQNLRRLHWIELDDEQINGALFFSHFHEEHESDIRAWLNKKP